ncbi:3066_t:CDS:1, partial [Cetraspora pellucida]
DSAGLKYFHQFSGYDFIDVKTIDHCVRFIKVDNLYYIVDNE